MAQATLALKHQEREAWFAIRHSADGYDYLDVLSLGLVREETETKCAQLRAQIPGWDDANRVVRIVKGIITVHPDHA